MADICKCYGVDCPIKETCYRFLAPEDEWHQAYFLNAPLINGECEYYWRVETKTTTNE